MARFQDIYISREGRFSMGRDEVGDGYYLSIPVCNRTTDYEEYYSLSAEQFEALKADRVAAQSFAEQCRERTRDDLLILRPGLDRGTHR